MELRSGHCVGAAVDEYNLLRETLESMGLFEEGMQATEMREFITAIQNSTNQGSPGNEMERALRESEEDFRPRTSTILNSTMIQSRNTTHLYLRNKMDNDVDSDNSQDSPEILTVQALVHHPMDWSPPTQDDGIRGTERLTRKRLSEDTNTEDSLDVSPAKRSSIEDFPTTDSSQNTSDSGFNWSLSSNNYSESSYENLIRPEEMGSTVWASRSSVVVSDETNTSAEQSDSDNIAISDENIF